MAAPDCTYNWRRKGEHVNPKPPQFTLVRRFCIYFKSLERARGDWRHPSQRPKCQDIDVPLVGHFENTRISGVVVSW